jgi:hypothetical protein
MDELFPDARKTKPMGFWTKENITIEAKKYKNIKSFKKHCGGAYDASWKKYPGLLDALFPDKIIQKPRLCELNQRPVYWTKEKISEEAKKHENRIEMKFKSGGAYCAAKNRHPGLLDELFPDGIKQKPKGYWTKQRISEEASKYKTKIEFLYGCGKAYQAATQNHPSLLNQLFENKKCYGKRDVVYIMWVGADCYKFGITSSYKNDKRINELGRNRLFDFVKAVKLEKVNDAPTLEKQLLKLGGRIDFQEKFDGYTEFRKLTPQELNIAIGMVNNGRIS